MSESTIITGQFVHISQTPASIGTRILALAIDFFMQVLYIYSVSVFIVDALEIPSGIRGLLLLASVYLPVLCYSLLWEVFNHGQSIGKKIMNIRVVKTDGSTPTMSAYLLRWLLFLIDGPLTGGLGLVAVLMTHNSQRLGDLTAGTMVIKEKNYHKIHVSLDEFDYLTKDYQPVYPQAADLSLEQIHVITRTLESNKKKRARRVADLAQKVQTLLAVTPRESSGEQFLQTLVRDYQYYALEEL
ncbi:transmembrane protein [gut metagenome]|uniref:Transmembrane protein n=1 Tax=gut metagenome TaxID=749906 RepID=J9GM31_9ZZZZ